MKNQMFFKQTQPFAYADILKIMKLISYTNNQTIGIDALDKVCSETA